jgi:hypothetical protein
MESITPINKFHGAAMKQDLFIIHLFSEAMIQKAPFCETVRSQHPVIS